jgi:hypothetical protein
VDTSLRKALLRGASSEQLAVVIRDDDATA